MPESKIVRNGSAFLLEIDGQRMPLYGYMSYQPAMADYDAFRKAGVHLFFTGVYAGDRGINQESGIRPFRPGFWKGYGEYDFSAVDEDFHIILDGGKVGEDYLIPRLMVEPPSWWEADNPGELCRDAQGTPLHHSYQSKKWREDTRRMLFDFQNWLNESGWAKYVPGWHIACGNTEEWAKPRLHPLQFSDYSEPARRAFCEWAKEHYGTVDALNEAWGMRFSGFDMVRIPSPAQRMFGGHKGVPDPLMEKYVSDYYLFHNEVHAQAAVDLCAMAKEATGRKQVVGAFFGYMGNENGQNVARMVLRSEHVDFLASPFAYTDNRGQGVDWEFPGFGNVESSALHGKPWFMEADVRTCLSRPISQCMPFADPVVNRAYDGPVWWGPKDVDGSLNQMKKAFARVLTNNTAIWWFDMWGGWYRDPRFMAFHEKAAAIYREHVFSGGSENVAPIAIFVQDAIFTKGGVGAETDGFVHGEDTRLCQGDEKGFVGTPYRMIKMDDFEAADPARFRLAVFYGVHHWTEGQKKALESWKKDGRILAFTGSIRSGLTDVIGTDYCCRDESRPENGFRLSERPGDVVFSSTADGTPAEILRRYYDYSIYLAIKPLTTERMRILTAAAGGQVYSFDGDVVYASSKYVAIHAATDGVKRIAVPLRARFVDLFTGETLPGNETFVDINMQFGETRILRIEPIP